MSDDRKSYEAIVPGHEYSMVTEGMERQTLQFIEKGPDSSTPEGEIPKLVTLVDGVTNETVIEVLLDRMHYLNEQMPSSHNDQAIAHLEGALSALQQRTAERTEAGTEGTTQA